MDHFAYVFISGGTFLFPSQVEVCHT